MTQSEKLRNPKGFQETAKAHHREAIKRARERAKKRHDKEAQGVLVAEGDSWFDYPGADILDELKELGYDVYHVANGGDTMESMAYEENQIQRFLDLLAELEIKGQLPRAILLSGGGNDISGEALKMLLNHQASGLAPLNKGVLNGAIMVRLRESYRRIIQDTTEDCIELFSAPVPIIVHGYAHAVPDGRGFWGGWLFLPGPWLKPAFDKKGYTDLDDNTEIIKELVDEFNKMLKGIADSDGFDHVEYVDLREHLSNESPRKYKKDWADELHPSAPGFERIAKVFHKVISEL